MARMWSVSASYIHKGYGFFSNNTRYVSSDRRRTSSKAFPAFMSWYSASRPWLCWPTGSRWTISVRLIGAAEDSEPVCPRSSYTSPGAADAGGAGRGSGSGSEREGEAALPGDLILGLVVAVPIELVHVVAGFGAEAPPREAVFDPGAGVPGGLAPAVAGADVMDRDPTGARDHIGNYRAFSSGAGDAQHHIGIVGELVERRSAEGGAAGAVLCQRTPGPQAHVPAEPVRAVHGAGPTLPPVRSAGTVQPVGTRQAAEGARDRVAVGGGTLVLLRMERDRRHSQGERREAACDKAQHKILHGESSPRECVVKTKRYTRAVGRTCTVSYTKVLGGEVPTPPLCRTRATPTWRRRGNAASIFGEHVVRITVQPPLARFLRRHDRVFGGARVLRGMLVGRAVAAQRRAALLAGPQMHPLRADLHALGALPPLAVPHGGDRLEMNAACIGHREPRLLVQHLVDGGDRDRSLPDGGRRPLDAPAADVAHREHAGQAGFQEIRGAAQRPMRRGQVVRREIRAGLDESAGIEREAALEPRGTGSGARHGEDVADALRLLPARPAVPPGHPLEMVVPLEADDFGAGMEHDRRVVLDATDQIAGHRVGEPVRPDDHVDAPGGLRQEHGGLTGRVAAAHDHDLVAAAQLRLHEGRGVIHARALELRQVGDGEPAVLGPAGDDDRARRHARSVVQLDAVRFAIAGQALGVAPDHQLGPELLRLVVGTVRQVLAGDPGGEAEVVLDTGARARLATGGGGLEHEDVESLRRAVHRRREPGGSRADDHQVAQLGAIDRFVEAQAGGELAIGRITQHDRTATDGHGDVGDADLEAIEQVLDTVVAVQVEVRVRMAVPGQELLDAQRSRAVHRAHEHDVAQAAREQLPPAQQEGTHQDLAQLAVGRHQREQMVAIDLDHCTRLGGADAPEPATAREHADLTGDLPRSKQGH